MPEDIGLPATSGRPSHLRTFVRATVRRVRAAGETWAAEPRTETGVRARRSAGRGTVLNPERETRLEAGDVVLFRGPEDGIAEVYQDATGEVYDPPEPPERAVRDLERAVDSIVLMKDMSELAVDLAYGAVLFDSTEVAEEVVELEAEVDALQSRFEAWTLRAAADVDDPVSLRGLVHLARSTEVISDAALEMSEGVLRRLSTHPVVTEAVRSPTRSSSGPQCTPTATSRERPSATRRSRPRQACESSRYGAAPGRASGPDARGVTGSFRPARKHRFRRAMYSSRRGSNRRRPAYGPDNERIALSTVWRVARPRRP